MKKNIRMSLRHGVLMLSLTPLVGCSGEGAAIQEPDQPAIDRREATADQKGYYYHGDIILSKAENDEKVYRITRPMMYPMLYGHTIPIPVPDYRSKIVVRLGDGTVIDHNSVKLTVNGREEESDMPAEGTTQEYNQGVSVTRLSADAYELTIDPLAYLSDFGGYEDLQIMMRPIPYMAFDDSAEATDRTLKFESPSDFDLPEEIALHFLPYTFTDNYRPIRQYHLYVY